MDYNIKDKDINIEFEEQRENVKNNILQLYINERKKMGISQQDIADKTGIKRANVARIESGKYMPTIDILVKLALALNMELNIKLVKRGDENE